MEPSTPRANLPRAGLRYHYRTQNALPKNRRDPELKQKEEDAPLLVREERRRSVMGKDHRQFHRRVAQASPSGVLTVGVEVVMTVDGAGSTLTHETVTQSAPTVVAALAAVSSEVEAVSSVLEASLSAALPSASADISSVLAATPSASVAVPSPSIAVPSTADPTMSAAISSLLAAVPSVSVSISSISATVPSVSATVPSASVAIPSVSVAVPSVSLATPAVLAAVPTVPAYPSYVLPSVPSVPAYPSDLTVPAYPQSSSAAVQEADVSTKPVTSSSSSTGKNTTPSPVATSILESSSVTSNSTSSSSTLLNSISISSSLSQSVYTNSLGSLIQLSSYLSESTPTPSISDATAITSQTTAITSQATATSYFGGGGGGEGGDAPSNTAGLPAGATTASPTGTTAPASADDDDTSAPLETPQVVGSVVGSLAGAALIFAVLLLLFKRHKRNQRGRGLVLTGDNHTDNGQSMRQAPPTSSSVVPAAFLNRFSGMSRSTVDTHTTGERSFQRVSGRKLPSAFSEGMTSGQFMREGGSLSGTSFYQDDHGTYGGSEFLKEFGPGPSKEFAPDFSNSFGKETGGTGMAGGISTMNIRPGPARTPIIRHPHDEDPFDTNHGSTLSPPLSPNTDFPTRNTLGRSLASADGSRSSRFTENV
ncbi:hypothetical protein P153DRAFT_95458 [Dothidotthia symphoricarpi CBS 119687]|uniref:Uncharacterized protein n=1 Tax=Dothidotthia symphoricarpi CBS 119687 TaxID=1392245 RepID=A0A6A6A236_9PLEO|nr:uncharacterized protein P153DRAFT_95458 [Dothidotthia symphoricarpi CBS 119687]KAF2125870.1 hypothetical protein P153DRAFT_95458 [Dothidotthia symphoricarpi CBS 119687]